MKIAVLLSGKSDLFHKTKDILEQNVLQNYDCDVYVHTWKNHLNTDIFSIDVKSYKIETAKKFNFKIGEVDSYVPSTNTYSQFYSFNESLNLSDEENYDFYVKTRFDVWFLNKINFKELDSSKVYLLPHGKWGSPRYSKEWLQTYPHLNKLPKDFLFIFGSKNKQVFKNLYNNIENYNTIENIILCGEDIFFHHMAKNNICLEVLPDQDINGLVRPDNHHQGSGYIAYTSDGFYTYLS
jgi:hypothetical protein